MMAEVIMLEKITEISSAFEVQIPVSIQNFLLFFVEDIRFSLRAATCCLECFRESFKDGVKAEPDLIVTEERMRSNICIVSSL